MKHEIISVFVKTTTKYFLFVCLFLLALQAFAVASDEGSGEGSAARHARQATAVNGEARQFQQTIKNMAIQLFENLEERDPQVGVLADGVAFTVFVDLKKLTRTSSLGRYLAEQLMTEFQQQGYSVVEMRKSKAVMVQAKRGEYGLSRDTGEIASAMQVRNIVTGTYTLAGDNIMVNAKILDHRNSAMLSSATVLFERNVLLDSLLSDSASAYPKKDTYVYMKKIEL